MYVTGSSGIGDQNDFSLTRGYFLHVGQSLLEYWVVRRDDDHRHVFIDERNRAVLELACGVPFGVNIGDFFELERPLERHRKAGPATGIEDIAAFCEIAREILHLRLEPEPLRHYPPAPHHPTPHPPPSVPHPHSPR